MTRAASNSTRPLTVAVAGASGFIGRHIVAALLERTGHRVLALSRSERDSHHDRLQWRACDVLRHDEVHAALAGADVALYLVHSMQPQNDGNYGRFPDFDLLAADNFARAARANGVEHIVYVGGIIPEARENLSEHLRSRLEVERALAAHEVPLTALRAALIIGAGGSSFRMMLRLVERLPVMVVPRWTQMPCEPIGIEDVVDLALYCLAQGPEATAGAHEIGGPDVLSYHEMMQVTADVLGVKRSMMPLPVLTPKLSALWVSLITRTPMELVKPLVGSLRHEMVAHDRSLQTRAGIPGRPFAEMVADAIASERALQDQDQGRQGTHKKKKKSRARRHMRGGQQVTPVRAIDRLEPPPDFEKTSQIAAAYLRWLDKHLWGHWLYVRASETQQYAIGVRFLKTPIFIFERRPDDDSPNRAFLHVAGGLLGGGKNDEGVNMEFRRVVDVHGAPGLVLAIVEGYQPVLPRRLYHFTQAPLHHVIMKRFARALLRSTATLLVPDEVDCEAPIPPSESRVPVELPERGEVIEVEPQPECRPAVGASSSRPSPPPTPPAM